MLNYTILHENHEYRFNYFCCTSKPNRGFPGLEQSIAHIPSLCDVQCRVKLKLVVHLFAFDLFVRRDPIGYLDSIGVHSCSTSNPSFNSKRSLAPTWNDFFVFVLLSLTAKITQVVVVNGHI